MLEPCLLQPCVHVAGGLRHERLREERHVTHGNYHCH